MTRRYRLLSIAFCGLAATVPLLSASEPQLPTLTLLSDIMADPDWMGLFPERPYWADDGKSIYHEQKRKGSQQRDLHQFDLAQGKSDHLTEDQKWQSDVRGGDYSSDRHLKQYTREGDLYIKDIESGSIRQLTRTADDESNARFLNDDESIQFRRGGSHFIRDLITGLESEVPTLKGEELPKEEEVKGFLQNDQLQLFDVLREQKAQKEAEKKADEQERNADPERLGESFYLGKQTRILEQVLSPSARWLAVRTSEKKDESEPKRDVMPEWVREDGYIEAEPVRPLVGSETGSNESLLLIDLESRSVHKIDLQNLPERENEPLEFLNKESADDEKDAGDDEKGEARPIVLRSLEFSSDQFRLLYQAFSTDNKDRWIGCVDLISIGSEVPRNDVMQHWRDEAWINGRFTQVGWIPHTEEIWFLSEHTGYSHLYRQKPSTGETVALTSGAFEVSDVEWSHDGRVAYFVANEEHPGIHEVYRVDRDTAEKERLTHLRGNVSYELSPDESMLLLEFSDRVSPGELYLQPNTPDGEARRLTHSASAEFTSRAWTAPEVVEVPSRHGPPIYARLYQPKSPPASGERRPAVFFVHGAGYLQNAHFGWSYYFREFMFHQLLVEKGFVVLDMDYRASAGYGRDWRTAIYRNMGTPEIEDLQDGALWLEKEHQVDPERMGIYGGSYGGFLTLMALFRQPDLFACGAALRPVTDWAHYNHGYTSNILNTPEQDPEAYRRSSPIYFAEGLTKPLLMCHGMLDDNVFVKDAVRLSQRLIELEKEDWELALYPVEGHGFRTPSSWLDEYRRILKLFETHLTLELP